MSDSLCTHYDTIIVDLLDMVDVPLKDQTALTEHLQTCKSCRRFAGMSGTLIQAIDQLPKGSLSLMCHEEHVNLFSTEDPDEIIEKMDQKHELTDEDIDTLKKRYRNDAPSERCEHIQRLISEIICGVEHSKQESDEMALHIERCAFCRSYKRSIQQLDATIANADKGVFTLGSLKSCEEPISSKERDALLEKMQKGDALADSDIELLNRVFSDTRENQQAREDICERQGTSADQNVCGTMKEMLFTLFHNGAISEKDSRRLSGHLDDCERCRSCENELRDLAHKGVLLGNKQPALRMALAEEQKRYTEGIVTLFEKIIDKRSPTAYELSWFLIAYLSTDDKEIRSKLFSFLENAAIEPSVYCPDIAPIAVKTRKRVLTASEQDQLDRHLKKCTHCFTLYYSHAILSPEKEKSGAASLTALVSSFKSRFGMKVAAAIIIGLAGFIVLEFLAGQDWFTFFSDEVTFHLEQVHDSDTKVAFAACVSLSEHPSDRVVYGLSACLRQVENPEVRAGCILALLKIGTKNALEQVEEWERLFSDKQEVLFRKFWSVCPEKDRKAFFKALIDNASARILIAFISSARENKQQGVVLFCSRVYKAREERDVKVEALYTLGKFKTSGGINLKKEFESALNGNMNPAVLGGLINLARITGYESTSGILFEVIKTIPEDWSSGTRYVLTMIRLYLFEIKPHKSWSNEERVKLINCYEQSGGSKKLFLALVLAQKNYPQAVAFIKEKLYKGTKKEKLIVRNVLHKQQIESVKPCLEDLLNSPPAGYPGKELESIKEILKKYES